MSNTVEESISTICVILSFLCSLDIMCHPCLHNSRVPDPALFASHTDHKSESTAHKSCATEYWIKAKHPLGRSCKTSMGLGAAEVSPEHMGIGTGPVVLSGICPLVRCLGQAVPGLLLLLGPFQAHLYSHAAYMNWTMQLLHRVPVTQSVNILSKGKKVHKTFRPLWVTIFAFSDVKVPFKPSLCVHLREGNQSANSPVRHSRNILLKM